MFNIFPINAIGLSGMLGTIERNENGRNEKNK